MDRRHLLSAATGAALTSIVGRSARAQERRVRRIGELNPLPPEDPTQLANERIYIDAFEKLGWRNGQNLEYVKRTGLRDAAGWDEAARELVAAGVDMIVAFDDTRNAAALRATRQIPVVALSAGPVELGFAQSLARPGGNFTGVSFQAFDENGKVVELLRSIRPGLQRIGLPWHRTARIGAAWFDSVERAAAPAGIKALGLPPASGPDGIAPMLGAAARDEVQALVLPNYPFLNAAIWRQITEWAVERKVVTRSGLLSRGDAVLAFGSNLPALLRLHVAQIDRVLRGANPAELPIAQPTLWDTIINQRLARAVGWPAPPSVLIQATEVIE